MTYYYLLESVCLTFFPPVLYSCFVSRCYWQKKKLQPYVEFMEKNYPPDFKYQDFAPMFTAEFFDAKEWTDIFAASGAKYIVLTTKHHEGTGHDYHPVSYFLHLTLVGFFFSFQREFEFHAVFF